MKSRLTILVASFFFWNMCASSLKEVVYVDIVPQNITCILGADIGGTNSDFGIFYVQNKKPILLFSLHARSADVFDFTDLVISVLEHAQKNYGITIQNACIGAPGPAVESRDFISGVNIAFDVDGRDILQKTQLQKIFVINDFEVLSYGIDALESGVITLQEGTCCEQAPRAVLGAGTGLGTCFQVWDHGKNRYVSIGSEAGHSEFCPRTEFELKLKTHNKDVILEWEDLLGHGGIGLLYNIFIAEKMVNNQVRLAQPTRADIFSRYNCDVICKQVADLYIRLYARYARSIAVTCLPRGGLYLVGGVVAKNARLMSNGIFMDEFCAQEIGRDFVHSVCSSIPVYLVTNYNVSLYGAAQYLLYELHN